MKLRCRAEQEIVKNLNQSSLQDLFLSSPADRNTTNSILTKVLNHLHHFRADETISTYCPIRKSLAA